MSPHRQTNPFKPVFLLQKVHLVSDFFGVFFGDARLVLDAVADSKSEELLWAVVESSSSIDANDEDENVVVDVDSVSAVVEEEEEDDEDDDAAAAAEAVSFSLLATASFTRRPSLSLLTGGGRMSSLSFRESDISLLLLLLFVVVGREFVEKVGKKESRIGEKFKEEEKTAVGAGDCCGVGQNG